MHACVQGPVPNTAGHFWLMVWEQKSRTVIMLNRIIEKGQVRLHICTAVFLMLSHLSFFVHSLTTNYTT